MSQLGDLIKQIIKPLLKDQVTIGIGKSVDKDAQTAVVTPVERGADFLDVRLRSTLDDTDTGVIIYPVIGSRVMVGIIHNDQSQAFIAQFSEFESLQVHRKDDDQTVFKMLLNADGTLNVDATEWTFNDGLNGGLINLPAMKIELAKITAFIKALTTAWQGAIPTPQDGGAAHVINHVF